jgi:hypothetical protein
MSTLATTNIKHPSSASNNIVLDSSGNVVLQVGSASTPALQPSGDTNTGIFFPAADTIAFAEGGVESMRITNGGYFKASNSGSYASTSSSSHEFTTDAALTPALLVRNTSATYSSDVLRITSDRNTTNGTYYLIAARNGNGAGNNNFIVLDSGDVKNTNNSYGAISDAKLKENIVDANSQWDDLKTLQVRNYNLKEGQTHTQIGLIAQEVELVSPGLVSESPDRDDEGNDLGTVTKSVNYSVLYMKAVKALQEAMERIETLEAKVAALEGV